jgi:hypothetical protein
MTNQRNRQFRRFTTMQRRYVRSWPVFPDGRGLSVKLLFVILEKYKFFVRVCICIDNYDAESKNGLGRHSVFYLKYLWII